MFNHYFHDDDIKQALENVLKAEGLAMSLLDAFWRELNSLVDAKVKGAK